LSGRRRDSPTQCPNIDTFGAPSRLRPAFQKTFAMSPANTETRGSEKTQRQPRMCSKVRAVCEAVPADIRDSVVNEMVADLMAGDVTLAELEKTRPQYVKRHRAAFDNRFRDVSIDQPLPGPRARVWLIEYRLNKTCGNLRIVRVRRRTRKHRSPVDHRRRSLAQLPAMPDGHLQEAWPISNARLAALPSINLTARRSLRQPRWAAF
jgi:hypothetical protein